MFFKIHSRQNTESKISNAIDYTGPVLESKMTRKNFARVPKTVSKYKVSKMLGLT